MQRSGQQGGMLIEGEYIFKGILTHVTEFAFSHWYAQNVILLLFSLLCKITTPGEQTIEKKDQNYTTEGLK